MLPVHVALVTEIDEISVSELTKVGAALQKQVVRDFGPIWDVQATVNAFTNLDDVPLGYWPIIVMNDIQTPNALGIHKDKDGQPLALVQYTQGWTLTVSHECLEMLADPFGSRLVAGASVKPKQGRVEYLVEVCDPCEDESFAYTVNDVMVSDFYTPNYFDPHKVVGVRYSYSGAITSPRQVLEGGYLSWHDLESDHWWQEIVSSGKKRYRDLGRLTNDGQGFRAAIDRATPVSREIHNRDPREALLAAAPGMRVTKPETDLITASKAAMWRQQIQALNV